MVVCSILFYFVKISYQWVSSLVYARLIRVMIHYRSPCFCTFVLSELYRVCLSFGYVSSCLYSNVALYGFKCMFYVSQHKYEAEHLFSARVAQRSTLNAKRYISSISSVPSIPEIRFNYLYLVNLFLLWKSTLFFSPVVS